MEIKLKTPEDKAIFQRMLFEILLALAKGHDEEKDETYFRAVSNTEELYYSANNH